LITFKLAVRELPICYSTGDFMVTKCIGTCNGVLFILIKKMQFNFCADGVWYYTNDC